MQQYIVFLRAVNVSGKHIIKMQALKAVLQAAGFGEVTSYIQSGNLVLKSRLDAPAVGKRVKELIAAEFQLDIDVFVKSRVALQQALDHCPYRDGCLPNRVFITFLDRKPDAALLEKLEAMDHKDEVFAVWEEMLYFYLPEGMATSKMSNNYFESKLKLRSTGRNVNTVKKMLELAE
ncbi:MAG: DUF1697 domain-containing protein [Sphingobacteriales bacterium]|nr:MAG: DUF1697 domain-containing protein [Sphingobacteriales bacterium]